MSIMRVNPNVNSMDEVLDTLYGAVGTVERENFRKEAYAYCVGQLIYDTRKQEKITQEVLARRVGTDKSYISKVEKGVIEPGVGMFYRIMEALGMRIEIVKPIE